MKIKTEKDGRRIIDLKDDEHSIISIITSQKMEMEFNIDKFNLILEEKGEENFSRKQTNLDADLTIKRSGEDYILLFKKRKSKYSLFNSEDSVIVNAADLTKLINELLFNFPQRTVSLLNKKYSI